MVTAIVQTCRGCGAAQALAESRYCRACGIGDEPPSLRLPACDAALGLLAQVLETERRRHVADTTGSGHQGMRMVVEAIRAAEAHVKDLRRRRDWQHTRPAPHRRGDRVVMRGAETSGLGTVRRVDDEGTWVQWDGGRLDVFGENEHRLLVPA